MYEIHTTPGYIIGSRPYGEAGKMLSIFTRDLGLIMATAQGIRLERSKLRYHTQDHSMGDFSLVRGREFWRLTSADAEPVQPGQGKELMARIAMLLKRLLHGEEANPALFACVEGCAEALKGRDLDNHGLKDLESLTVLKMLHALGYVAETPGDGMRREEMNRLINKALKESHL